MLSYQVRSYSTGFQDRRLSQASLSFKPLAETARKLYTVTEFALPNNPCPFGYYCLYTRLGPGAWYIRLTVCNAFSSQLFFNGVSGHLLLWFKFAPYLLGRGLTLRMRRGSRAKGWISRVIRVPPNGQLAAKIKIHGFPAHFDQVPEPEKRSGFSHSLLIVQVPLVYRIWPKKHRTGWSSYLLGTPWTKICFHYMGNTDLL